MARNIDAEVLLKKIFPLGIVKGDYPISAKAVKYAIEQTPTADVIPRSEVEELARENECLAKTVNEASELIHKLQNRIEKAKTEVASEIFEEIDSYIEKKMSKYNRLINETIEPTAVQIYGTTNATLIDTKGYIAELKKKYTERKEDGND